MKLKSRKSFLYTITQLVMKYKNNLITNPRSETSESG